MKTNEITQMLRNILQFDGKARAEAIKNFQNAIWEPTPETDSQPWYDIANDLALDIDYYEPNPEWRRECFSFYGDEKLEEIINTALRDLRDGESG